MDGGATFYIALAASAAGTAVSIDQQNKDSLERQRVLEAERRANELVALDQENERLISLREADSEILAQSGGVDPWASPSLIAARIFNFETTIADIENIQYNLASNRSGIDARVNILRRNRSSTRTAGMFSLLGDVASGLNQGAKVYG